MGWTFFQSLVGHTKILRNFRTERTRFTINGFAAILEHMTVVPMALSDSSAKSSGGDIPHPYIILFVGDEDAIGALFPRLWG